VRQRPGRARPTVENENPAVAGLSAVGVGSSHGPCGGLSPTLRARLKSLRAKELRGASCERGHRFAPDPARTIAQFVHTPSPGFNPLGCDDGAMMRVRVPQARREGEDLSAEGERPRSGALSPRLPWPRRVALRAPWTEGLSADGGSQALSPPLLRQPDHVVEPPERPPPRTARFGRSPRSSSSSRDTIFPSRRPWQRRVTSSGRCGKGPGHPGRDRPRNRPERVDAPSCLIR
jgi:hypothetical protein